MIDVIVRYLRAQNVPFRLDSYGSSEPLPAVAHRLSEGAQLVETRVLLADGRPIVACVPAGMGVSTAALGAEIGGLVVEAQSADLPPPFDRATPPVPPLGGVVGATTFVDAGVLTTPKIAFRAFSAGDFFELAFEDFARIESPRVCAFASMGELDAHASGAV